MYQDTKNTESSKLPLVLLKLKGNQVNKLKKDEFIWHCIFEDILRITIAFISVEKSTEVDDEKLFEKSTTMYLKDAGFNVISAKYYDNADTLKEYLLKT